MHRVESQDNIKHLTEKWIKVCQRATLDLQEKAKKAGQNFTVGALLGFYYIDEKLVSYNAEDDCFDE